jgi:uncharacterized protein YndB with AHSA1/START domain
MSEARTTVRLQRLLPATPQDVFAAWTDPDSIKEWMCPDMTIVAEAQLDVRVGGRFRIVMRAAHHDIVHTGEYREIRPPERLVFTWRSIGTLDEETLVTVELHPHGEDTELVLIHERLPNESVRIAHSRGWQSIIEKLAAYLR